ncbi:MAG: hypothetical protein ACTHVE_03970 [Senegalia sp. (in: firmicutes)]|uniref:hypothetical protein n=1 Tax=Senegalia sp. (in: firmicutes) TaxID=1924098 RepID=UPI003F9CD12F
MIGNKYLAELYSYEDQNTGINQLLELLKYKDQNFLKSLTEFPVNLNKCTEDEMKYLTIVSALIDYYLQINTIEVPEWLRDNRLAFKYPYYHSKRLTDFEKFKLLYSSTGPFARRNVYFDLKGLERI